MTAGNAPLRVMVLGSAGRMGSSVAGAVSTAADLEYVGGVDPAERSGAMGAPCWPHLDAALAQTNADVIVDFTTGTAVRNNAIAALAGGCHVVIGATGVDEAALADIDSSARQHGRGAVYAPNFAIGAVLLMQFAEQAARWLPDVEIIELHHDRKVDAPSGTSIATADRIAAARRSPAQQPLGEQGGTRGIAYGPDRSVPIHSVRLPGLVAHQAVIFGGPGQTLTIRHDSLDRASFMPGVLLAIRAVPGIRGLVRGLDALMAEGRG